MEEATILIGRCERCDDEEIAVTHCDCCVAVVCGQCCYAFDGVAVYCDNGQCGPGYHYDEHGVQSTPPGALR